MNSIPHPAKENLSGGNASQSRWTIPLWLLALIPLIETLATWDFDGVLSAANYQARHMSLIAVAIELIVIYSLFRLPAKGNFQFKPGKVLVTLGGTVLAFAIASTVLNSHKLFESFYALFRYGLHAVLLWRMAILYPGADKLAIFRWFEIITIGAILYIAALAIFAITVPVPGEFDWLLRMPSATNIRQIGDRVAILSIAPICLLAFGANAARRWYYFAAATLIVVFIAWTGTRGALVGLGAGLLVATAACWTISGWKNHLLPVASLICGVLLSLFIKTPDPNFGLIRIVQASSSENIGAGRVEIWKYAIGKVLESPWLGHGSSTFRDYIHRDLGQSVNHPHNFILQFTFDWGVIGGGSAILLLAFLGFKLLFARNISAIAKYAALAGYGSLSAIGMIDGVHYYPVPIIASILLCVPALSELGLRRGLTK